MPYIRIVGLIALLAMAGFCRGADETSEEPESGRIELKTAPRWVEERRMPLFLDFGYEWRSHGDDVGWNTAFFHVRPRMDDLAGEEWRPLTFGLLGRFERAYQVSPNPERWFVGASFSWDVDHNLGPEGGMLGGMWENAFPLSRAGLLSVGGTFALGYMHSTATQEGARGDSVTHQDAIRIEHCSEIGIFVMRIELGGAVNINLQDGPGVDAEFFVRGVIGRPISPVGIAVGYMRLWTQRGGGDLFTLGMHVAF